MSSFRRLVEPRGLGGGGGSAGGLSLAPAALPRGAAGAGAGATLASTRAPGTKPWVNGQSLVSSGNKDMDGTSTFPHSFTREGEYIIDVIEVLILIV